MKRRKGALRLDAVCAKNRLVTGCFNKDTERKLFINNSEDDTLSQRVVDAMKQGNCDNLLGVMLDKTHMETLGEIERQRYVFNMSALLQKTVERMGKVV